MSKTALELIAENKLTKSNELDLGGCGLTQIPEEICELTWLENLSLADAFDIWTGTNWYYHQNGNGGGTNKNLYNLQPLSKLSALKELIIAGTMVADLSPIANLAELNYLDISSTKVTNLYQLTNFHNLETLDVSYIVPTDHALLSSLTSLKILRIHNSSVSDLTPISKLPLLEVLSIIGAKNSKGLDLSPLVGMDSLQALDIWLIDPVALTTASNIKSLRFLSIYGKISDITAVKQLSSLKGLSVSDSPVTDISLIKDLVNLEYLDVSGTNINDISPVQVLRALRQLNISDTKVTDITPVRNLVSLESLFMREIMVTDLSPLSKLINLQVLDISDTKISDLTPLKSFNDLVWLEASNTNISDLTPLASKSNIQKINISNTKVSDLTPINNLFGIEFPILIDENSNKKGLCVNNCPVKTPPLEIVHRGSEAIVNYFKEINAGDVDYLYEAKLIILGEGGAGKTSLLRRLYEPDKSLPSGQDTTKGIDIHRYNFKLKNGQVFNLNIWDFGGQEIYHATHQFFLTRRSVYILVDDTRKDYKSVSDDGFKYWLDLIGIFGENSATLIFQNEKGGRSKAIDFTGIKALYGNVLACFSGNLEHNNAVDSLRDAIEYHASCLDHIGDELPATWVKIRAEIEERTKNVPYINLQEYFDIYKKHMQFDKSKALYLSQYLHDLGVFLHFQNHPLLIRTVILQNEWATEAVFRILDDEIIKAKLGRFDSSDYQRLWHDSKYSDMHLELLELMKRFEICYELADSVPQALLAPQLLPPTKPISLNGWAKVGDLVLRYHYDFMPKGLISRLTVRLNRYVANTEMAWNNGVLFEKNNTKTLVELMATGSDIEIRARGPEAKVLHSAVSSELEAINSSFHTLHTKVDKLIPCQCKDCLATIQPELFSHKNLLKRKLDNRFKVECPRSYEYVDVLELLDGIRIDGVRDLSKKIKKFKQHQSKIKIFLASSSELRDDRDNFELYFRQQNDQFICRGIYLEIIRWEFFLDQISITRKQDDYNEAVRDCDIFVSLFFTKTGRFSEEEFDIAHKQFKKTGSPQIYTYFKDENLKASKIDKKDFASLKDFEDKLNDLGHFYTYYSNIEDLKLQFKDQLVKLLDKGLV